MPGSIPPTSQLDWLISTTVIRVLSWSRATRDLLKSFGWGIGALHQLPAATMVPSPRRLPHTISPLEGTGFELAVPGLCSAIDPIERLVEHGFMPGAVPRLDIGLDLPKEFGTRPLLGGQALGTERAHLAVKTFD